jgi:DUSP domain.
MALKPNLKYNDDFYIVSYAVWQFLLHQYGGGPLNHISSYY